MSSLPEVLPIVLPITAPPDQVFLTVTIRGQDYDLSEVRDADAVVAVRAWRVAKLPYRLWPDGVYFCRQDPQGVLHCDCNDFLYRGHRRPCKHLQALTQLGFLQAEQPRQVKPRGMPKPPADEQTPYRSAAEAAEHLNPVDVCNEDTPF